MTEAQQKILDRVKELRKNKTVEAIKRSTKTRVNPDTEVMMKKVKRVEFKPPPEIDMPKEGLYHYKYPDLLRLVQLRRPIYCHGPSGSGKTKTFQMIGEQLGMDYHAPTIGKSTTEAQLVGYWHVDKLIKPPLRLAWENGGIVVFEEFDTASAPVATQIQMATSSDYLTFPDKTIKRHKDCVIVATGNTLGTGATREYNARQKLDGATTNRFIYFDYPYDDNLEHAISINRHWTNYVQAARAAVAELKIQHIISPRQSIIGGEILAIGFTPEETAQMILWQGLDDVSRDKVIDKIGGFGIKDAKPTVGTDEHKEKELAKWAQLLGTWHA